MASPLPERGTAAVRIRHGRHNTFMHCYAFMTDYERIHRMPFMNFTQFTQFLPFYGLVLYIMIVLYD